MSPQATRERFAAATKLYDARSFAEALPLFQELVASTGSPNARFFVARCLVELGRFVEGYDELAVTVREAAAKADADPKYAATRDAAASELAVLERRIARLVVALSEAPAGTEVSVAGKRVAPAILGMAMPVLPGKVHIEARSPDGRTVVRDVDAAAGALQTVVLALTAAPPIESAAATSSAPIAPPPPSPPRSVRALRVAGVASLGIGVAGAALWAIGGASARSKFHDLESGCGSQRCSDPRFSTAIDDGKRAQTLANVGIALTFVGFAAGGALLWLDARDQNQTSVGLAARLDGLSLDLQQSF